MSSWPERKEVEEAAKLDGTKVLVVGNRVYDASQLVPSVVHFTRSQYLFLQNYRLGTPLEEAALKANLTPEEADRFLDRPKTRAWLEDRAVKDHIRNEWAEPGKWWEMGDAVLKGDKHLSKDQQVVYMAFGERIAPKPRMSEDAQSKTTINFNFSPESVKEAFRRQAAIETELEGGL